MARIWIVDDEADFRMLVRMMLEREGHEVLEIEDGRRCLELLEQGVVPDLILLDVMMPEMDGWEVCRKIKSNRAISMVPVCILTAKTAPYDMHISLNKAHANWHLNKPIEREKLLDAVNWLLQGPL